MAGDKKIKFVKEWYMKKIIFVVFLGLLFIWGEAFAVPSKMNFQGKLTDSGGNPITSAVEVVFTIYDASSGGTVLWTETIAGLTPDQGLINQELGLATPITSGIFSGDTRYLAIKVGADAEMTPRIPLATVPFAFRSAVADSIIAGQVVTTIASTGATPLRDAVTLSGGTGISLIQSGQDIQITAVSTAGGTVTQVDTGSGLTGGPINTTGTVSIAAGGINATHLGTGVVTDGAIANNTITEPKIQAMNDPVNSYLLTYTATGLAWSPAGGTGTVTQVDTGSGLTGGPINTTGTVSIAAGGINATHLGTGVVTDGAIANNTITEPKIQAMNDPVNSYLLTYTATGLAWSPAGGTGTVTQVDTGSGLTGGPINTTGTVSIAAGGINATHLGTGVVTDGAIANNTITEPKIQAMNDPVNSYLLTYTATGLAWSPAGGTGTVTQVDTGSGLTGGPINTTGTVSIAAGGINATHLGTGAVTAGAIAGSAVITSGISDGAVTAAKIGSGQVVTSIASSGAAQLKDDVTFSSGTGISLNQVGQHIQITAVSTAGGTVTQVNTQAPVLGGPITTTGTISMPAASGAADGYLTSGDWTTFNNKLDSADLSGYVQLGPTIGQTTTAAYAIQVKTTHASGVGISGETTASSGSGVYGANSSATGGTGGLFLTDRDNG